MNTKPSAADMHHLIAARLSTRTRLGYVALLLVSLSASIATGSLLLTEPNLPLRTSIAMGVMSAISLSWVAFAAWVLVRREVLLAREDVVAARMATAFCTLFTLGALAMSIWSDRRLPALAAGAIGIVMTAIALVMHARATRRLDALMQRRAILEQQLSARNTGGSAGSAWKAATLILLTLLPHQSDAQGAVITPSTFTAGGTVLAAEDGKFTVPANRTSASGKSITLAFVRFKSTSATPGSPIVFLAGGPGDAATRAFRGIPADFLKSLTSIADVIAFDQRATGFSEPLNPFCAPGPMLPRDRPTNPAEVLDEMRRRVEACLAKASTDGIDVLGLTTQESADDIDALRKALGAAKVSLLAGSYGTHLALATARRHPNSVDRMVLAGVEGPDDTFKLPSRVDEVLANIAKARRPSLVEDIRTLTTRLSATPVSFTFPTGQTIVLGAWDLHRWIAESLDTVQEIDAVLTAIPSALAGDFAAVAQSSLRFRAPRLLGLMNLATDCASYGSAERLSRIAREKDLALLGDAINFPLPGLCSVPGLPRLGDAYRALLSSEVPALLISGTFDGRTPPQNAIDVARGMPRSRMLVIDGASHGLFRESKALEAMLAFLR